MKRNAEIWLNSWYHSPHRKPLVLRGARQVGKSYLVRQVARNLGVPLYEINCEKHLHLDAVFASFNVTRIIQECEFICGIIDTTAERSGILFLDEVQATPNAIAALRYFFEEHPQLPVIAAGSLLEFALSRHNFSMPVGRIEFYYLGPMTFLEFLDGIGEEQIAGYIRKYHMTEVPSETAHVALLGRLRDYFLVGGMPEAAGVFASTGSFPAVSQIHESIIETYRSDFAKYAALDDLARLRRVFDYVPSAVGNKIKYVNIDSADRSQRIRAAFDLLVLAGIIAPVKHSSASGVPLAALVNDNVFKPLFLDIGLMNAVCGIRSIGLEVFQAAKFINEGAMAEQFIGQHLLYAEVGVRPALFYWLREEKSGNAEIDYLMQINTLIVPVEVKAGKSGSLKSLHRFAAEKKTPLAVRFDLQQPSVHNVEFAVSIDKQPGNAAFRLLSLPLYMVEQCRRLIIEEVGDEG